MGFGELPRAGELQVLQQDAVRFGEQGFGSRVLEVGLFNEEKRVWGFQRCEGESGGVF